LDQRPVPLGTTDTPRRTAANSSARVLGRHPLGAPQRRPMERFTRTFPLSYNLLAATQGVDRVGIVRGTLAATAATPRRPQTNLLERSHRRRDVCPGKKGGAEVGKTKRGKGSKLMLLVDGHGTPLAVDIHSASPAEVRLIEPLLGKMVLQSARPAHLLYDRAADSDPLRERLRTVHAIELVTPHRRNCKRPATQDGRSLRRYARRWKVERTISWLHNFRRLVVRYEYYTHLFLGFVQLACAFTILKRF
jgi:transposase